MSFLKRHSTQIIIHLLFWILFTFISLFVFTPFYWSENPFLQYFFILVVIVYTNNLFLLPYFIQKRWYFLYVSVFASISFMATQLYCQVFARCGCSVLKCLSDYLWQTITPLIFFSFIWMLFRYIGKTNELEKLTQERTELELKFLKSQINPHVLLNNLNTLYSFSLEKPNETPELILKLADNLKHVLYESSSAKVDLNKELLFIDNYIEFQRLRTEGLKEIRYECPIQQTNLTIAPLLLITIIENTFKHSSIQSKIEILITLDNGVLTCTCKNEYDKTNTTQDSSIGLKNLKKRLQLLYPDNYTMEIRAHQLYEVVLKLNLL